ncbi:uncharacterized protein LOC124051031 [Tachysurus ichikawai]
MQQSNTWPSTLCIRHCSEEQQTDVRTRKSRPLAMLMEEMEDELGEAGDLVDEMEEEPLKGPEGAIVDITINSIETGDWLAVVYDDHWWLVKSIDVDIGHQDVKVEFMHPCGPTANFHPKHGRRDVCFCPLKYVLLKLTGTACPLQVSRTTELYAIALDVIDFIERRHVQHLLSNAQFLQKGNFFLFSTEHARRGLKGGSWNFFEASHGKGAPDGVGGTLKRTADKLVTNSHDIPDAHELYKALTETSTTVKLFYVSSEAVEQAMEKMPGKIPPVPSTMKTHQVVTSTPGEILYREISCMCSTQKQLRCHNTSFYF